MYWLHLTKTQKKRITQIHSTAEIPDPFADQSGSLRWTALMITGTEEMAERSVIDATGLAQTSSRDFRDWLVLWAHLATARTALDAVRSSIQETAKQYADWTCSHTATSLFPGTRFKDSRSWKRVKSCSSSTFWPGLFWFFTAATALRSRTACSCYLCRFNPLLALTAKLCSGTRRL